MGTRNWRCLCIDDNSFNCGSGGWGFRLEANAGLLTNCEALQLLQSRGADKGFGVTAAECKVFSLFFSLFENRVSTLGFVRPSFLRKSSSSLDEHS
jgi:hypothetical protein